jgi:uncharacterized protein (TIGR00730 family)
MKEKSMNNHNLNKGHVTVFAASSGAISEKYFGAAARVGEVLAEAGLSIMYGGGNTGLMGAVAGAALEAGTAVHGIVPRFLKDLEVSHNGLTSLTVVDDMRERKHLMLKDASAVVTLPGGCGTYEEVFEALTLKRLGQWLGPIVLVNTGGFYDQLHRFLEHAISERFMDRQHAEMWSLVDEPEELIDALYNAPAWSSEALEFATLNGD